MVSPVLYVAIPLAVAFLLPLLNRGPSATTGGGPDPLARLARMLQGATFLCVLVSALTAALLLWGLCRSPVHALVCACLLICSKAFVDYSTSGLENPLTHLLLVLFLMAAWRGDTEARDPRDGLLMALPGLTPMQRVLTAASAQVRGAIGGMRELDELRRGLLRAPPVVLRAVRAADVVRPRGHRPRRARRRRPCPAARRPSRRGRSRGFGSPPRRGPHR